MKTWVGPTVKENNFLVDQNVAISGCYTLYCIVAGDGKGGFNGTTNFGHDAYFAGTKIGHDGQDHGEPCAKGSSLDTKTGNYYEYNKKSGLGKINIIGSQLSDGRYQAEWTSTDINGTGKYQHYGYAINDQPNKPNHS